MKVFDIYMNWYLRQNKPTQRIVSRLFENHSLYISNSKGKISYISCNVNNPNHEKAKKSIPDHADSAVAPL